LTIFSNQPVMMQSLRKRADSICSQTYTIGRTKLGNVDYFAPNFA
jgi:hypothetical protein